MARVMAREIADPLLLKDQLGVYDVLWNAARASEDMLYLCVENADNQIIAHTFAGGFPVALTDIWRSGKGQIIRFRTNLGPIVDVSAPVLTPELGTLHLGLSRCSAILARRRLMWVFGLTFVGAVAAILGGTRLVVAKVSSPLRQLERGVSRFPEENPGEDIGEVSGTWEVESLAKGFSEMAKRLDVLERERAATHERMIHTERLAVLGQVAAGLAHEIHNPLSGMLQCVRYLRENPDEIEEATEQYYPMMEDGLQRIARVMEQMLTFVHSGQNVSAEACGVAGIVGSLRPLVESHVEGRKVRVTWRDPGSCMCLCDPQALSQAALNLILNAVEAAEGGGADPEVLVEASCDTQWVYVSVEDTGPGVSEDLRERIFDPFFTTKPVGKGTGLGLSVSRQLIRAVGGEVELSGGAASLGGARFVMRIPKAPDQEEPCGQEAR